MTADLPTETWAETDCIRHLLKCSDLPLLTKTDLGQGEYIVYRHRWHEYDGLR